MKKLKLINIFIIKYLKLNLIFFNLNNLCKLGFAYEIEFSLYKTLNEKEYVTKDIGGNSGTKRLVERII